MLVRPKGIFGDYEMPFLRQELPPKFAGKKAFAEAGQDQAEALQELGLKPDGSVDTSNRKEATK
jgi:hypothetical protein